MAKVRLTVDDEAKVAAAIRDAESRTDGEIAAIVAERSDAYHDAVLQWALIAALLPLAVATAFPGLPIRSAGLLNGGWEEPSLRLILTILLIGTALVFLIARLILGVAPVRMLITPRVTKARRVRRRAVMLFRISVEQRTATRTGVLLYVSLAERRAEIVADKSIHAKVDNALWGKAMAALLDAIRDDRPGDGLCTAIGRIADVLAEHFPHTGTDPNELPDRLVRL